MISRRMATVLAGVALGGTLGLAAAVEDSRLADAVQQQD